MRRFEREIVRKSTLYDKKHVINIDNYVEDDLFVARTRSHPISDLYEMNKNNIDSMHQRYHRRYNIRFERKYLKILHTIIYRAEII